MNEKELTMAKPSDLKKEERVTVGFFEAELEGNESRRSLIKGPLNYKVFSNAACKSFFDEFLLFHCPLNRMITQVLFLLIENLKYSSLCD